MTRNIALGRSGLNPVRAGSSRAESAVRRLPPRLAGRSIVLVGLMGAGNADQSLRGVFSAFTANDPQIIVEVDREKAKALGVSLDECSIAELFSRYGERAFRDGERRVIRRLLDGGPLILATGGGAFMDPRTRAAIRDGAVSVWLRCRLATLLRRVAARSHRPLLNAGNPAEVLG